MGFKGARRMSAETEWAIEDIRQSIDKLNENLVMIAYQLYISNSKGMEEFATIKNFLADKEELQKGR
tara:strand:+ start:439 stop:639 length:201 start_codon:yes stop_codon:yes gene_type:complete